MNNNFQRIERLPPYVFNIIGELKSAARARGEDIIDFGMGNPDQATPQHIVDKLIETVQRGDTHRYSQSKGIPRLRRAICNWYKDRFDVDLDPESDLWLVVRSEGLRETTEATVVHQGLRVQRELLNVDGSPLRLEDHRLGELVTVRTTLENLTGDSVANIALVDRLPAGWELENPRLGRGGEAAWVDPGQAWVSDHMNLRDDRLEVFGTLEGGERREVVYQVRAVSAGTFTLPPVEAEAMYDPELKARQPGGEITVRAPWGDEVL